MASDLTWSLCAAYSHCSLLILLDLLRSRLQGNRNCYLSHLLAQGHLLPAIHAAMLSLYQRTRNSAALLLLRLQELVSLSARRNARTTPRARRMVELLTLHHRVLLRLCLNSSSLGRHHELCHYDVSRVCWRCQRTHHCCRQCYRHERA